MTWTVLEADCVEAMAAMDDASVDACVCDPPYGLEFMGKEWDRLGDIGKVSHQGPTDRDPLTVFGRQRVAFNGSSNVRCRGFDFVGIEREPEYVQIANARIAWWAAHPEGVELVQALEADGRRRKVAESGQLDLLGDVA